jgi:hypothetical protein
MTIAKVLAVYKTSPIVLIVESAESTVCELSLTDLHGAGHRLSDDACTSLSAVYLPADARLARGGRPPAAWP